MKKYLIATLTLILALALMQSVSLADTGKDYGYGKHQQKSVKEKFFKKVKMIYLYQGELNVTDKQLDQIHVLKVDLKKDLIMKKAELDIIKVDIRSLLQEDEIDVDAVNKLLDKKYEIKKAKSKKAVEAYAGLKKILSMEQIEKLKNIAREYMKMHMSKGMSER